MMFHAPLEDYRFILRHVAGFDRNGGPSAAVDAETLDAILTGAGQLCEGVLAPLNRAGDVHPARLEDGIVHAPPGFAEGYRMIADGGWIGISAPPGYGGMGLPLALSAVVQEMMAGACLSLQLLPVLARGAIEAIARHAGPDLRDLYLPRLISGEWTATMNLTEPQAGSDLGAIRCRAEPRSDGTHAITGEKIFITWGDHDLAGNIIHLVLARLPGAPAGAKGISLFLVPKHLPDADGNAAARNRVEAAGIERKLGIHGSPTCTMRYDGATGWLVGGENGGLAAMFTMMNNARLGVGGQGIGMAEAAYQQALAYARERVQGNHAGSTIIDHADVRRMILTMRAEIFAIRAIAVAASAAGDLAAAGDDGAAARVALLTPIVKAHGTDIATEVASAALQVHGGLGYIEDTGIAQLVRDARVLPIYEGTNGIQAMDLAGRKLADGGRAAFALLDEVEAAARQAVLSDLAAPLLQAVANLRGATRWMVGREDVQDRLAGAAPYLRGFARVLGAGCHLRAAEAAPGGAREHLARFFIAAILPEHEALLARARLGADVLFAHPVDEL
ncbi:acyl-CoA dehydrogenase [Pontibaca methylaminivorans]|nr:acyl-CoA dehydrogenase [Pontibaca methylaminivorans]